MNRETAFVLTIVFASALLIIDTFLSFISPSFIADYAGQGIADIWEAILSLMYLIWGLLIGFVILSTVYLFFEQLFIQAKTRIVLNDEKEIVLSEHQKQKLIARGVFEISLIFNSQHRGLEAFSDDDSYLKFAVMGADGKAAESEMVQYIGKHLGKKVVIEAGKADRTRRWDRIITLC